MATVTQNFSHSKHFRKWEFTRSTYRECFQWLDVYLKVKFSHSKHFRKTEFPRNIPLDIHEVLGMVNFWVTVAVLRRLTKSVKMA